MPVCLIEAPLGISSDARSRLVKTTTAALDEAYHVPDVRIFLREYPPGSVAQDGRLQSEPVRPVCFIEAPPLRSIDAKRALFRKVDAAVADAYQGIANTKETLILMNEYQLENAGFAGRLQSDNPEIIEALKRSAG